jgi:hypothetical protein
MPDTYSSGEDSTIFEREVIPANTGRISRIEEEVPGTTFVGERIFLCDGRNSNARDDKGINKESI